MNIVQQVQSVAEQYPFTNWLIVAGSAALAWIQPVAGIIAIALGGLQIYGWIVNKGWQRKP
jgi:hypothetical protein